MTTLVHLHTHSEYSELDGLARIQELVNRAKELGMKGLGLTDHGVCGGIPHFIKACQKAGINPIAGCEIYMTHDRTLKGEWLKELREKMCKKYGVKAKELSAFLRFAERNPDRFEEEAQPLIAKYLLEGSQEDFDLFNFEANPISHGMADFKQDVYEYFKYDSYHLTVLAKNNQGLSDLYEIVSNAHLEGFYSDPRTDLPYIRSRGFGHHLIALSGCLGGYFSRLALAGKKEEAKAFAKECQETFGHFYLEKQATAIPDQIKLNHLIDEISQETGIPKVVTTDIHYCHKEDHDVHDVLVAGSTNKCLSDTHRMIYAHEFWMKSEEEVRALCDDEEAIQNTLRICEMVEVSLPKEPMFPKFPVQEGDTPEQILEKKAWDGLFQYALKKRIDMEEYSKRLKFELDAILPSGFADYFLIVSDFVSACKKNNMLVGPGRGSVCGSLVAFCIKITSLDPIPSGLLFERFLNPDRVGLPDIDLDFAFDTARWVQMYMKEKYGWDHVAQIGTYGTLAAKASIHFVGKVLGFDLATENAFAKTIPSKPGITLEQAYMEEDAVRRYAEQYPDWWRLARKLEGQIRSSSVHAGGIVLSPVPISQVVPYRLDSENLETTMYDMEWIEQFLVKFDILKLGTLDLIKKTMEYAGILGKIDIDDIDLNDPFIYQEIYHQDRLNGIFQVEGEGMRQVIRELKPTCFEDISAILALYRPGPMDFIPTYIACKKGQQEPQYPFPELEPILKETYGVWTYQEQVMAASRIIGGFSRGQSDILRKGIAKKKMDILNEWLPYLIYGCPEKGIGGGINRGFDEQKLKEMTEAWIKFGDYAFNKSHSAAYAKVSIQTAYLAAYYPVEFKAALLKRAEGKKDKDDNKKIIGYLKECEEMGITILPPDINQSTDDWIPDAENKTIRFSLTAIDGISGDIQEIIGKKPYHSIDDFVEKINNSKVNKTKVTNLIKAGAFNSIDPNRNGLIYQYYKLRNEDTTDVPVRTSKTQVMKMEREVLGLLLTYQSRWQSMEENKENVQITGTILTFSPFKAKSNGKEHARMIVETAEDEINVMVFNKLLHNGHRNRLMPGLKVTIKGNKQGMDLLSNSITYVEGT